MTNSTMAREARSYSWDDSFLRRDEGRGRPDAHGSFISASSSSASPQPLTPVLYRTNFGKNSIYRPPVSVWNQGKGQHHPSSPSASSNNSVESEVPFDQCGDNNNKKKRGVGVGGRHVAPADSSRPSLPDLSTSLSCPHKFVPASSLASDRPFDETQSEGGNSDASPASLRMSVAPERRSDSKLGKHDLRNMDDESTSRRETLSDTEDNNSWLLSRERSYHSDHEEGSSHRRYRMVPPRISDPILTPYLSSVTREDSSTLDTLTFEGSSTGVTTSGHSSAPPKVGALKNVKGSGVNAQAESKKGKNELRVVSDKYMNSGNGREQPEDDDDDNDSIFDFEDVESRRRKAKKWRNSRRAAAASPVPATDEDDEDNETDEVPPTTLTERAQVAWKRKSAQRASRSTEAPRSSKQRDETSPSKQVVHFSEKKDTIHQYELDRDETVDSMTFGGRSINSEYTKSAESEVEDFIKDILMIGSGKKTKPGRRKVKDTSHVQNKIKRREREDIVSNDDVDDEEDLTLDTMDDDPDLCASAKNTLDRRVSSHRQVFCSAESLDEPKKATSDPLTSVWNYIEGAVSSAFGIEPGSTPQTSRRSVPTGANDKDSSTTSSPQEFFDGETDSSTMDGEKKQERELKTAPSLEEDVRLVDLALQAARSMHKLRGFEYDESTEINIASDIRFSVVDLRLPLGLIFQENETGCWVTKVLPEGSAAKSRFVEVGDQLAAIDGVSAIKMNVEQIAGLIRRKTSDIELTFLRYVGPWRPAEGTVAEEGYEVRMQTRPVGRNRINICGPVSKGSGSEPPANTKLQSSMRPMAPSNRKIPQAKEKKGFLRIFGKKK